MKNTSKTLLALLLAPLAIAAAASTAVFLFGALSHVSVTLPLLLGAAVHLVFHNRLSKSGYAYIAAHECSHALAAVLSGAKIKKISVGRRNGYVLLDSSNIFITLAPYFVPFYAAAAGLIYFFAGFFADLRPARPYFLALSGFLLSFHTLSTAEILSGPLQSDIKKAGGRFFSYTALIILNSLFAVAIIKIMFPGLLSFKSYLASVALRTKTITFFLVKITIYLFNTAKIYLSQ
ncbi:MAG: M50 family metallopeptidase [Elusimicrobia bacterium]|nr:M50 family metallopeptidase [Elusimicrobiota bacterium]